MEATSNPEPRPASLAMVLGHLPGVELVGVAQDGDEVVAPATTHRPEVVLMDLRMPSGGATGWWCVPTTYAGIGHPKADRSRSSMPGSSCCTYPSADRCCVPWPARSRPADGSWWRSSSARRDLGWAAKVHGEMARAGLTDIDTVTHAESWPGRSPGARLYEVNVSQLQPALLDAGLGVAQFGLFRRLMHDPRFVALSYPFVSTRGRRPIPTARHAATAPLY